MAVIPTGAIYKSLSFDGESSRNYGVYITGEAVYNAPARDVEMIKIPGRNGEFALDNGRFENIEVTYPAGIFADNEADFAAAVSDFRNFLASRSGYCRLEDDYNPNEYRMAVYKSGLDVDPKLLQAGEFEITFDCKPQRWLTDGETAVTVASGDELTNPTLFESQPLLAVKGYGTLGFNGYEIELADGRIGDVQLFQARNSAYSAAHQSVIPSTVDLWCGRSDYFPTGLMNSGDSIRLSARFSIEFRGSFSKTGTAVFTRDETQTTAQYTDEYIRGTETGFSTSKATVNINFPNVSQNELTQGSLNSKRYKATVTLPVSSGTSTVEIECTISSNMRQVYAHLNVSESGSATIWKANVSMSEVVGDSSVSRLGDPTYLDCEMGEAYKIVDGNVINLNSFIEVGAELPTLAAGANEVTFDNTVTELKITPRWWKI